MRAWVSKMLDQQVGLDEYLPGTPRKGRNLLDAFPYHLLGRGSTASKGESSDNATAAEKKFREADAVRRRQFPSCFEEACAYGNLQAVILMWSQGTVDIPTRKAVYEGNSASALMWASFKGHLPIVRFLLDHGAPIDAANALGHTALQWAITAGHTDVVRYLLDHGADPSQRDRQGFDAAFSAAQNGRLALLVMLTEDASRLGKLLRTSDDGTVLYQPSPEQRAQAATRVNPRSQKPYYLLDPTMRDVEGHTLLHWAAYRNSPATCQYLLVHWSYAVDATDKHGRTPLVWAAREGFAEVIELLLSYGADRSCADSDGWTALQYARTRNHPEAVYVLETYPVIPTKKIEAGDGVFPEVEYEGERMNSVSDSASAALLGSTNSDPAAEAASRGGRYVCVRDRRAYGTLQMIRTHTIFAFMAVCGPLYLAVTCIAMNLLPPVLSYFPFGIYFFSNVLWTSLSPHPTQSSRTGAPPSVTTRMGIAANIADSVRGTWLFRTRDPSNLFLWAAFLLLQLWAWNRLGLPPLFASSNGSSTATDLWPTQRPPPTPAADIASTASPTPQLVHYFGLSFLRLVTFQTNPLNAYGGAAALESAAKGLSSTARAGLDEAAHAYVAQSEFIVRYALMSLFLATLVSAVLCKQLSTRSVMRISEEGTLRTSPLWRILAARQYRWLHPRFTFLERHMQLPLRAFYCHEHDVVVRGYDGYSTLLDTPVGQSNHLCFVLALTFFTLFEILLMVWGYQHMHSLQQCPAPVPWYTDALLAFQSTEVIDAAIKSRALATPAATDGAAPVISLAWIDNALNILLHGLPCRQYHHLDEVTRRYLQAVAASKVDGAEPPWLTSCIRRLLFVLQYYLWPTRAAAMGVWILHYSVLSAFMIGFVAVRQWIGVWSGATRMELANPLAQGRDGELIYVFPKDPQQAQRFQSLNPEEERYYAEVCPDKARPVDRLPDQGSRCIYADGNGWVNLLRFLVGQQGKRWRGAMTVSSHNAPVKTPMLM
ncbi:hypothetical protein ABL78_5729 [Leptomonas seymouri]|uniref:Uncharacterized protein n=1 Tax=Leptomonas seymouri TaxID=5684 RepID=A0A0N1I1V5_LEPSE|nr:hypothetical protein ABL78_5729 [Leptomonas seymouri]|eukprot:KPI85221.1 hypothetical protein ABL78_5729 [Leptomonas seymouri]